MENGSWEAENERLLAIAKRSQDEVDRLEKESAVAELITAYENQISASLAVVEHLKKKFSQST